MATAGKLSSSAKDAPLVRTSRFVMAIRFHLRHSYSIASSSAFLTLTTDGTGVGRQATLPTSTYQSRQSQTQRPAAPPPPLLIVTRLGRPRVWRRSSQQRRSTLPLILQPGLPAKRRPQQPLQRPRSQRRQPWPTNAQLLMALKRMLLLSIASLQLSPRLTRTWTCRRSRGFSN